jgi:hypothetical protein
MLPCSPGRSEIIVLAFSKSGRVHHRSTGVSILNWAHHPIAPIQIGHWLCALYVKRVRIHREDWVSDKSWWYGQYRMSRTHVFLRCMHPNLEGAR